MFMCIYIYIYTNSNYMFSSFVDLTSFSIVGGVVCWIVLICLTNSTTREASCGQTLCQEARTDHTESCNSRMLTSCKASHQAAYHSKPATRPSTQPASQSASWPASKIYISRLNTIFHGYCQRCYSGLVASAEKTSSRQHREKRSGPAPKKQAVVRRQINK